MTDPTDKSTFMLPDGSGIDWDKVSEHNASGDGPLIVPFGNSFILQPRLTDKDGAPIKMTIAEVWPAYGEDPAAAQPYVPSSYSLDGLGLPDDDADQDDEENDDYSDDDQDDEDNLDDDADDDWDNYSDGDYEDDRV